jgi:glutamyl-tRNA reductase
LRLLITGVSHKTAPVEVRERLAVSEGKLPEALCQFKSQPGVLEALILSTCNRVEVMLALEDGADVDFPAMEPQVYKLEGREAIHHLFRVASSLDSMVLGEPQILGQLKTAFAAAKASGTLCGWLESLMERSFRVAKRVRSETGIGQMAVSVSYAAVELARKIFGSLDGRTVMIVGGGKMSELAARHLRRSGASHVFIANRTYSRAVELAQMFQGTPVEYARFPAMLPEMDIVITSSAAPHYLLTSEEAQRVIAARRNRPMFLIDIAVPRNIEPSVNKIDNVFLYNIDDLQQVVNANLRERQKEAERAEAIVEEEVERTMARLRVEEVKPHIVGLQEQLEAIRKTELERTRRKYGPLTPELEEAYEALSRGIVNKIAHGAITEMRQHAGRPDSAHLVEAIRRAFRGE